MTKKQQGQESVIQDRLGQAVEQIRFLTFRISPKILYDLGLIAALEWLAEDMKERITAKV